MAYSDPLARYALRELLERSQVLRVVAETAGGRDAMNACEALEPHAFYVEVADAAQGWVETLAAAAVSSPRTRIVAVIGSTRRDVRRLALNAGAQACLTRDAAADEFVSAGIGVPTDRKSVLDRISPIRYDDLTGRELSIVRLLARGMSNAEIATRLHVAEATVKAALGRVMTKFDVRDRLQVVIVASRVGLVRL